MKKKNGVNIMLFVSIIVFIGLLSCTKNSKTGTNGFLIQIDREFSSVSLKEGLRKAYSHYAADDGVLLRDNSFPFKGSKAIEDHFSSKSDSTFSVNREPEYEKMSASGDFGYTYGISTITNKLTGEVSRGSYVTIWKKQSDGSWKFVLDSGQQGLSEKP